MRVCEPLVYFGQIKKKGSTHQGDPDLLKAQIIKKRFTIEFA